MKTIRIFRAGRSVLPALLLCLFALSGWAQTKKAVLPYRLVAEKLVVDLQINGHTYPFMFDTGGTMGIIDRVCDSLQLEHIGDVSITDVTGRNIIYPKLKVDSLRIPQGDMAFAGIPVMKLPTPSTVERFGVVGLLGSDLWADNHCIVHIDGRKQLITVTSAEDTCAIDARYKTAFVNPADRWPVFSARFGTRPVNTLFDSGAYGLLQLREDDYYDLYSWNQTHVLERGFGQGASGLGGTSTPRIELKRVRVAPVHLGDAVLEGTITEELTTARSTILGMRLLDYGEVPIDYARRLFYFVPYDTPARVEDTFWNLTFAVRPADNSFIVTRVWGTDLRKTVRPGDEVLSINGRDITTFDLMRLLREGIPQVTGNKKNTLVIKTRKGERIKVPYERTTY